MFYAIDTFITMAKCIKVEASSEEEAYEKVEKAVLKIISRPTDEIDLKKEGFEVTEDFETECSGHGETEDTIVYR